MKIFALAAATALIGSTAAANEFGPAMQDYMNAQIMEWANDPVLIEAIRAQNEMTAGYSPADIDAADQRWRAEVGTSNTPTISPVIDNAAADFLRSRLEESGGTITEVFIMDAQGLNVAATGATSDYWQGDEAKFSETYEVGPGAVHMGDIEFDESSQRYQGQVSITIVDPATNTPVGAMTVGLDAESLL